jgi:hypothetical protein
MIERTITVDELAHWLTVMARVCPGAPKPRALVHYTDVKLWGIAGRNLERRSGGDKF